MKIKIVNAKGLHARASAKFAETVEQHNARATVLFDGMSASGDSIMGLMMLGAGYGETIEINCEGEGAEALEAALRVLIEDYFGEGG